MSDNLSVSPAQVGVTCATIGAGVGYVSAPEKYNLKQLLTQEGDVFEKSVPNTILQKAKNEQKTAYNSILEARKSVAEAAKRNIGDAKVAELSKGKDLISAYNSMKKMLPKARVQSMVIGAVVAGLLGTLAKIIFGNSKPAN